MSILRRLCFSDKQDLLSIVRSAVFGVGGYCIAASTLGNGSFNNSSADIVFTLEAMSIFTASAALGYAIPLALSKLSQCVSNLRRSNQVHTTNPSSVPPPLPGLTINVHLPESNPVPLFNHEPLPPIREEKYSKGGLFFTPDRKQASPPEIELKASLP